MNNTKKIICLAIILFIIAVFLYVKSNSVSPLLFMKNQMKLCEPVSEEVESTGMKRYNYKMQLSKDHSWSIWIEGKSKYALSGKIEITIENAGKYLPIIGTWEIVNTNKNKVIYTLSNGVTYTVFVGDFTLWDEIIKYFQVSTRNGDI